MSSNSGFLLQYITENPDCPLEDVLNDEELLEEIKLNHDPFVT